MKHLTEAALDELASTIETEMPEAAELIRNRDPKAIASWEDDINDGLYGGWCSTVEISPNVTKSGRPILLSFRPQAFAKEGETR